MSRGWPWPWGHQETKCAVTYSVPSCLLAAPGGNPSWLASAPLPGSALQQPHLLSGISAPTSRHTQLTLPPSQGLAPKATLSQLPVGCIEIKPIISLPWVEASWRVGGQEWEAPIALVPSQILLLLSGFGDSLEPSQVHPQGTSGTQQRLPGPSPWRRGGHGHQQGGTRPVKEQLSMFCLLKRALWSSQRQRGLSLGETPG